eukprot:COSAG02_NODE_12305_length_1565_cov_1.403820_2_plen_92_part_00
MRSALPQARGGKYTHRDHAIAVDVESCKDIVDTFVRIGKHTQQISIICEPLPQLCLLQLSVAVDVDILKYRNYSWPLFHRYVHPQSETVLG